MNPIRTERDIDALLRGSKALVVIAAWHELGLFQALAGGAKSPAELPAETRAVEVTAPVLRHLGLLHGDEDRLVLSDTARGLLERGRMPTARNFEFLQDQARMPELLEHGGPVTGDRGDKSTDGGTRADDPEQTKRFLDMLYQRSADSARSVNEWLAPLLPAGSRVLDLGGGHGRYGRTFADSGHVATLFDFPHVIDYARARHGDALAYIGGDFREPGVDFGGPYDLVLLSNVVHGEPDDVNRDLARRLAATLAPGGYLVLKDMFIDEHGRDPEEAVFFGLTMLFYTRAGRSHSLSQARSWLTDAGLEQPQLSVLDGFQMLRARTPPRSTPGSTR